MSHSSKRLHMKATLPTSPGQVSVSALMQWMRKLRHGEPGVELGRELTSMWLRGCRAQPLNLSKINKQINKQIKAALIFTNRSLSRLYTD